MPQTPRPPAVPRPRRSATAPRRCCSRRTVVVRRPDRSERPAQTDPRSVARTLLRSVCRTDLPTAARMAYHQDASDDLVRGPVTILCRRSSASEPSACLHGRRVDRQSVNTTSSSSASIIRDAGKNRFLPVEQCLHRAGVGRQDLVYPEYTVAHLAPNRENEDDVGVGPPGGIRLGLLNLDTVADPKLLHSDRRALRRGRCDHRRPRRWWRSGPRRSLRRRSSNRVTTATRNRWRSTARSPAQSLPAR